MYEKVKAKEAYLHSAYYELLIYRHSGMARVNKDHTVLPVSHTFIHKRNEPYLS